MAIGQWHGTAQEWQRLESALDQHCTCVPPDNGGELYPCPVHALLASQVALNHLLYVYRRRRQFIDKEFA